MAGYQYTAPNDFRAFCETLEETGMSMAHHGIKGQKWGERRFQDQNGKLTSAGRERYGVISGKKLRPAYKEKGVIFNHLREDRKKDIRRANDKRYDWHDAIEIYKAKKKAYKQHPSEERKAEVNAAEQNIMEKRDAFYYDPYVSKKMIGEAAVSAGLTTGGLIAYALREKTEESKYKAIESVGASLVLAVLGGRYYKKAKNYSESKTNKAIDAVVKAERKAPKAKTPWNEKPTPNTAWDEKPRKTRHNI